MYVAEDLENWQESLDLLLEYVGDSSKGLPEEVFRFISQLTPMVNIDMLIKNTAGQTLLTWRADEFYGPGWHIPGGIIRFKEYAKDRIQKVAQLELGTTVSFKPEPIQIHEIMAPKRNIRGHFISLLYDCTLSKELDPRRKYKSGSKAKNGEWAWHDNCPDNLLSVHEIYRNIINA